MNSLKILSQNLYQPIFFKQKNIPPEDKKPINKTYLAEVSVVGFDDSSIARAFRPQITTVSQPRFEMGKIAMRLLREKIVNIGSPNIRKTVEHKLVIRDTTRNGRAW